MDTQPDGIAPEPGADGKEQDEAYNEALRIFNEQVAELRARGIISGGEGPRDSLKPAAHIPGALARFLAERR